MSSLRGSFGFSRMSNKNIFTQLCLYLPYILSGFTEPHVKQELRSRNSGFTRICQSSKWRQEDDEPQPGIDLKNPEEILQGFEEIQGILTVSTKMFTMTFWSRCYFFKVFFNRCSYISTSPVSLAFCLFSSPCDSTLTLHSLNATLTSFLPFPLHVLIGYLTLPSVLRPQNTSTTISTYFLYHPNLLHSLLSWISVLIH